MSSFEFSSFIEGERKLIDPAENTGGDKRVFHNKWEERKFEKEQKQKEEKEAQDENYKQAKEKGKQAPTNLTKQVQKLTKKSKFTKNVKNVPNTKMDTISFFRNDLELVPKRREPQQRPLSFPYGTSS